jgi:hypothetical protein
MMIAHSLRCLGWAAAFAVCIAIVGADAAPDGAPKATIAILPSVAVEPTKATFTLSSDPISEFSLSFDVRAIPVSATVLSAKLRIVPCRPGQAPDSPQDIRIFGEDPQSSMGQLVKSRDVSPIESVGDGLKTAVERAVWARTTLKLNLRTTSRTPKQTYYLNSASTSDDPACSDSVGTTDMPRVFNNRSPRLLVEFSDGDFVARQGASLRYRDGNSNATPWKHALGPSPDQNAVVVSELSGGLGLDTLFAGPAFIGDEILLIAKKPPPGSPALYAVGWNGTEIWEAPLPQLTDSVKQWKYIFADNQDRLLAFASDSKIRVYAGLGSQAPANPPLEKTINDMNLAEPPLLTMGGMIAYRTSSFIYVLSPLGGENKPAPQNGWEPLMQFGPAGQAQTAISPWNGENLLYVTPVDDNKHRFGIVVFDPARGLRKFPPDKDTPRFPDLNKGGELASFASYNPLQVLARDPGKDLALLSGSGDSSTLWAYWGLTSEPPGGWSRSAQSISSCIASQPGGDWHTVLYCIDGSAAEQKFRKLDVSNGAEICSSTGEGLLQPSSNLVADGAGNVFFWVGAGKDAGFYGFDSRCQNIVFSQLKSSDKFVLPNGALDLHAGPNGVFYLTDSTRLIAIDLVRKTTSVAELSKDTRYAAAGDLTIRAKKAPADGPVIVATGGKLALGDLQVPKGGDVTCTARAAVTFGNGFRVEQGGVLRCGIDSAKMISP